MKSVQWTLPKSSESKLAKWRHIADICLFFSMVNLRNYFRFSIKSSYMASTLNISWTTYFRHVRSPQAGQDLADVLRKRNVHKGWWGRRDNKDVLSRQRLVRLNNLFTLLIYRQVAAQLQSRWQSTGKFFQRILTFHLLFTSDRQTNKATAGPAGFDAAYWTYP